MKSAQMTLGWHVDYFIITHESQKDIDDMISRMDDVFGDLQPLTVNRWITHRYLDMDLYFSEAGKVRIGIQGYGDEMLEEAPGHVSGEAATPAAARLFDTNLEATRLDAEEVTIFHHLVAKALFLCKRARPDMQLAVSFLCGRVK